MPIHPPNICYKQLSVGMCKKLTIGVNTIPVYLREWAVVKESGM